MDLIQVWNGIDTSTIVLSLLTLISLLVIYLQHQRILPSLYFNRVKPSTNKNEPSGSKERKARCRECNQLKPTAKLKICSNCKLSTTHSADLNFYYCDATCQKLNWKTHKLICGNFKNLQSTSPSTSSNAESSPDTSGLPPGNLFNPDLEKRRTEIEGLLKEWCEYHRNLLIFATIHGLDLLRNPNSSTKILFMISLNLNEENKKFNDEKIVELTTENNIVKKELKVHEMFSVAHIGSLDSNNFFTSNPGMLNACKEMEKVRMKFKEKGGVGAGMLLVRYGPIVHVIPVGLPPQADLDAVPRQPNWREIFDEAIKTGLPWKPPN